MLQMKNLGIIDHLVLGMYMRHENGNSSNIKFGGWDKSALAPGVALRTFRTYSPAHWDLKANNYMLGGKCFLCDVQRIISIDPHIPYLYIPTNDWTDFADAMTANFGTLHCDSAKNLCYFAESCASAP